MTDSEVIETERLKALLQKDLKNFSCSVCGHDEFAFIDRADEGLLPNLMLYDGDDPLPKKHTPLLTIACLNCGRLEQFAQVPLLKRLKSQETHG
jgi:hypothetical protein